MTNALDETVLTDAGMEPGSQMIQTPADLFRRWLSLRWDPVAIDLTADSQRWLQLDQSVRHMLRRTMVHFLAGEQIVTDLLGPLLNHDVPREDERLYLATQIADEAVHTVFFRRLCESFFGFQGTIEQIMPETSEAFRQVFEQLSADVNEVRRSPWRRAAWVRAVTSYHLVVEGFLGLSGQRALVQNLKHTGGFPGFTAGIKGIMQDESRHIIFGVIALSRRVAEEPALAAQITDRLLTLAKPVMQIATGSSLRMPISANAPKPPSALEQMAKRLRIIGVPANDVARVLAEFRSSVSTPS